jgi:hypothetical protein
LTLIPAVLGWSNPDTGPESTRLYATDLDSHPRWAEPVARTVEKALAEHHHNEGDRAMVLAVGNRFLSDEVFARCQSAALQAVAQVLITEGVE